MMVYDPNDHDERGVHKDHDVDKTVRWFWCGVCVAVAIILAWAMA